MKLHVVQLLIVAFASIAIADEPPMSIPSPPLRERLPELVIALGDRDPSTRASARDELMLLKREDLPTLRQSIHARPSVTQRMLLRDVVIHVYLTGRHDFRGDGPSRVGIILADDMPQRGLTVKVRTPGNDGYRVLQTGDVVVGVARFRNDGEMTPFTTAATRDVLVNVLDQCRQGDWVVLRFLRDGVVLQQPVRLSPPALPHVDNPELPSDFDEADRYWRSEFLPAIEAAPPATKPATNPAKSLS